MPERIVPSSWSATLRLPYPVGRRTRAQARGIPPRPLTRVMPALHRDGEHASLSARHLLSPHPDLLIAKAGADR